MGAIAILFFLTSINLHAQFSGGSGTQADPYQITSRQDMEALADSVNNGAIDTVTNWSKDKYFKVMNNITDSIRTCIGKSNHYYSASTDCIYTFQGNFDGQGYKITLAINIPKKEFEGEYQGLFGMTYKAEVKNVTIDGYIRGNSSDTGNCWTGGIAGLSRLSTISYCINKCTDISVNGVCIGGIVGHMEGGTIDRCQNYSNISAWSAGGIVGHIQPGGYGKDNIIYCDNYGCITAGAGTGGIVGLILGFCNRIGACGVHIDNCVNSGTITGVKTECDEYESIVLGGIVGMNSRLIKQDIPLLTISNCLNIGSVLGGVADTLLEVAGGILGSGMFENNKIENCINAGFVFSDSIAGGIAAGRIAVGNSNYDDNFSGKIENCINTGVVIGDDESTGGIISSKYSITVTNCYYDKQMCIFGGIGGKEVARHAEGRLTQEMTGDGLKAKLGTVDWFYSENLYPRLKVLQDDTVSLVAASPAYLNDANLSNYDAHNNIRVDFAVSTQNSVEWVETAGNVNISGTNATLMNNGADTTPVRNICKYIIFHMFNFHLWFL